MIYLRLNDRNQISVCSEEFALMSYETMPEWIDWQKEYEFVNGAFAEIVPPPPPPPTLDSLKFAKKLDNQMPQSYTVNGFELSGSEYAQTRFANSLTSLLVADKKGILPATYSFWDVTDTRHEVPTEDYLTMLLVYGSAVTDAIAAHDAINKQIDACETIEELNAIVL